MSTIIILFIVSNTAIAGLTWYFAKSTYSNKVNKAHILETLPPREIAIQQTSEFNEETNQALLNAAQEVENLSKQLKQKGIELAKQVKDNEDKNHILTLLKEKLHEVEFNPKVNKSYWSEMDRLLSIHLENNDKSFEIQMDELHQEYIAKLHKSYPELSVYELRLCAYIKIGMNSKEIAELLRVLPSSINVSRSRLRKKLRLTSSEDLFNFLNDF